MMLVRRMQEQGQFNTLLVSFIELEFHSMWPDQIAIGNYGPHLKSPSYHELRVPLLKKELQYTKKTC
ncbi:hypothetical protein CR513_31499, partial [Mucuna pruriens]